MYKTVRVNDSEEITPQIGDYNDFPPNFREIDPEDFWRDFFMYHWELTASRQAYPRREDGTKDTQRACADLRLWFDRKGDGIAMQKIVERARCTTPRFFRFGICIHEYKMTKKSRCYREFTCTKCSHRYSEDSSD